LPHQNGVFIAFMECLFREWLLVGLCHPTFYRNGIRTSIWDSKIWQLCKWL